MVRGRREEINTQIAQLLDAVIIAGCFVLAHWIRAHDFIENKWGWGEILPFNSFLWILSLLVLITPLTLEYYGFYKHPLEKTISISSKQIFSAQIVVILIMGLCVIFLRFPNNSRFVIAFSIITSIILILGREHLYKMYLRRRITSKRLLEKVLLAGSMSEMNALLKTLGSDFLAENELIAKIDLTKKSSEVLVDYLHKNNISRVFFAAGHVDFSRVENALLLCEEEGVEAWLNTDFMNTSLTRPKFDYISGKPMLVFSSTPEHSWEVVIKNLIDFFGGLFCLIISFPFWLMAFIGIKLSSKGPVFFTQSRCGRYGKEFKMYKFRSMDIDAEEKLEEVQKNNEMSGPVFKLENDPRVFKFGKFLRKFSIDEIPQLLNVIKGDMSLVGPRPLPTYEIKKIDKPSQRRRLSVKPGLTCIWQISGRNDITNFEDWVKLDLQYIDNWNIWLDIKIILKTIPVVLLGQGAK